MSGRLISMEEVQRHNTPDDCWIVTNGKVYDLTSFHPSHPGSSRIITSNAGKDASAVFNTVHPKDIGERLLGPSCVVGLVDESTLKPEHIVEAPEHEEEPAPAEESAEGAEWVKPEMGQMLNVFDFESVASRTMTREGWGYYSSGADDEITLRENHLAFGRIQLRPRVLVNVKDVDMTTTLLGHPASIPMYFTATAMGRLADEAGEVAIVRAADKSGVHYMLPTLSSCTADEMLEARAPGQVVFTQLYVNANRERTKEYVQQMEAAGCKALFVTVDAPQLGRREKDMRNKFSSKGTNVQADEDGAGEVDRSKGVAAAISQFIDPSLCWDDLAFFKRITDLPILLKGVQCAEDAVLAYQAGCQGIVLSNHGGRQLDTCRPGIEVLPEVMEALQEMGYDRSRFQVFVDGGVRRGSDVFKALALGATAVGIGRPVLYSLASYGQVGVQRMMELFKEELTMVMRLMGTPTIADISRRHVILRGAPRQARHNLFLDTYQPMRTARGRL